MIIFANIATKMEYIKFQIITHPTKNDNFNNFCENEIKKREESTIQV